MPRPDAVDILQASDEKVEQRRWKRAVAAAVHLLRTPAFALKLDWLLNELLTPDGFARDALGAAGSRAQSPGWKYLSADQLADVYLWAREHLPRPRNRPPGVVHSWDPTEDFRNDPLRHLQDRADEAAVRAYERIASQTGESWAQTGVSETRRAWRAEQWLPPTPEEVLAILSEPTMRRVATEHQLAEIVLDAIDQLSTEISSDPDVRQLFWHRQRSPRGQPDTYIAVSETEFTTRMVGQLRPQLREVVVRQEVQLTHSFGEQSGTFPDFEAIVHDDDGVEICVIGEVKGAWDSDVMTALEEELFDDYLQKGRSRTGIYIVPWPDGESWDSNDWRRRRGSGVTSRTELKEALEARARELSDDARAVHVRVVDLTMDREGIREAN